MSEAKEFRNSYFCESENRNEFKDASFSIWCYRGVVAEPRWKDIDTGSFSSPHPLFLPADMVADTDNYIKICTIEVDLSHITLNKRKGERGQYFSLNYDLVLLFGLTELKAQVAWMERVRVLRFP